MRVKVGIILFALIICGEVFALDPRCCPPEPQICEAKVNGRLEPSIRGDVYLVDKRQCRFYMAEIAIDGMFSVPRIPYGNYQVVIGKWGDPMTVYLPYPEFQGKLSLLDRLSLEIETKKILDDLNKKSINTFVKKYKNAVDFPLMNLVQNYKEKKSKIKWRTVRISGNSTSPLVLLYDVNHKIFWGIKFTKKKSWQAKQIIADILFDEIKAIPFLKKKSYNLILLVKKSLPVITIKENRTYLLDIKNWLK
ncbi:MAG: hypothetical protein ACM3WV_06000 [Bacillota bacterium]